MASGVEREIALAIVSDRPADVARRIAALRRIGGYRLVPRGARTLRDLYLDTPQRRLSARGLALRIRTDGRALERIALKGPSAPQVIGAQSRFEIEADWAWGTLAMVLDALEAAGVPLPRPRSRPSPSDPLDVLREVGMTVIQDRRTRRILREVVPAPGGPVLAGLAIDAVAFQTRDREVRHHEIEIEAATEEGLVAMRAVGDALMARFAHALHRRPGSKLAIGLAIEQADRAGVLDAWLGRDGALVPAAYEVLLARPVTSSAD